MSEIVFLTIGRGGWTGYHATETLPYGKSSSRTEHYGDTWKGRAFADGCVAVDTTVIPDARIVTFAVAGPMADVDVPAGHISKPFTGELAKWVPGGDFGNARGLDYVAPDVYATIAAGFGARVFDPAGELVA